MNLLKRNNGFTLIEIIVAINIAFIAITLIITIYIILNKVYISSAKKIEEKYFLTFSLNNLNELLRKEKYFTILIKKDTMKIDVTTKEVAVFTTKEVIIKDFVQIIDLTEYSINIILFDKTELVVNNKNIPLVNTQQLISSTEIEKINIVLIKNCISYRSFFRTPLVSYKRFTNI